MRVFLFAIFLLLITAALANNVKRNEKSSEESQDEIDDTQNDVPINEGYNRPSDEDPCRTHDCPLGRQCDIDDNKKAVCICIRSCPVETDPRAKVCSNLNETWSSECELLRMRCFCDHGSVECKDRQRYEHLHLEYLGECKALEPCLPEQMEDFPRRMANWLFEVMKDLARRNELPEEYMSLERRAEKKVKKNERSPDPVIWKFCDLDSHPHDRYISRHELLPIRAPLIPMEHCIAPFLDNCDINNDHKISLVEWGSCLGLNEDEIEDKCRAV